MSLISSQQQDNVHIIQWDDGKANAVYRNCWKNFRLHWIRQSGIKKRSCWWGVLVDSLPVLI